MKKMLLVISLILLLSLSLVSAISQQEIDEAKSLIDSKVSCDNLENEQLEIIGEYYMEQMHPGESHKLMHKMMGLEEGTEEEEQFHINMAQAIYCNENVGGMMNYGRMGMMNMMGKYDDDNKNYGGVMGCGNKMGMNNMMGNYDDDNKNYGGMMNMMPYSYGYGFGMFGFFFMILFWGLIIWLVIWIISKYAKQKTSEDPLDILKERYAKGEINKKQFEEMKKELK